MWPVFDGWCASRNVDPVDLSWDRYLNLVYYFATRNLEQDKRKELDDEMGRVETTIALEKAALTRKNALRSTQRAEQRSPVPETTPKTSPERSRKLPPKPAGWGEVGTSLTESMGIHRTLGGKQDRRKPAVHSR